MSAPTRKRTSGGAATAAERMRRMRARQKQHGLREIPVIVPSDRVDEIKQIAATMRQEQEMHATDQNGIRLARRVRQESDGTWGANVWSGSSPATTLRRYYYGTRAQAMDADISDEPGKRGCVRFGEYL